MSHPQLASCYRYRFKFEALEHGSAMSAMGPVLHYIRAADRLVTEETLAKSDSSNRVCASPNKSWAPRVSIRNTSDALSRRPFWPSSRPQDFVHLCLPSAQRGNFTSALLANSRPSMVEESHTEG